MNKLKLVDLREERNLKSYEVADKLKVKASTYSEWENNKESIPTKRLLQIANFFEVNIDYMLGLTDIKKNIKTSNDIDIHIVSKRIREIRKDLSMSMLDLAKKFNTTSSAISNYENEKYLILGSLLLELSKISGCSIDWILNRSKDKFIKVNEKMLF